MFKNLAQKQKKYPDCSDLMRLKKSTWPVLPQQSSTLKDHAEVVRFSGPPVVTGKNVVKFSRRPVLHPINNGGNADNNENENSDFSIDLHHHHTSTPGRNNSSSVSTPRHSHSSFLQNVTPSPTSVMPNDSAVVANERPTPHQGKFFALFDLSVISVSQIGRFFGHSIFLEEGLCVILHIELKSIAAHAY